jgi:hypothetical protein
MTRQVIIPYQLAMFLGGKDFLNIDIRRRMATHNRSEPPQPMKPALLRVSHSKLEG